jgi:hypothetical protein
MQSLLDGVLGHHEENASFILPLSGDDGNIQL